MVLTLGLALVAYVWAFLLRQWSRGEPRILRFLPELILVVALLSMIGMLAGQQLEWQEWTHARASRPAPDWPMPEVVSDRGIRMAQLYVTLGFLAMLVAHGTLVVLSLMIAMRRPKPATDDAPPSDSP